MRRDILSFDLGDDQFGGAGSHSVLIYGHIEDDGSVVIEEEIVGDTPEKERQIREIVELETLWTRSR